MSGRIHTDEGPLRNLRYLVYLAWKFIVRVDAITWFFMPDLGLEDWSQILWPNRPWITLENTHDVYRVWCKTQLSVHSEINVERISGQGSGPVNVSLTVGRPVGPQDSSPQLFLHKLAGLFAYCAISELTTMVLDSLYITLLNLHGNNLSITIGYDFVPVLSHYQIGLSR